MFIHLAPLSGRRYTIASIAPGETKQPQESRHYKLSANSVTVNITGLSTTLLVLAALFLS